MSRRKYTDQDIADLGGTHGLVNIIRTNETIEQNLRDELRRAKRFEGEADRWRESWEKVIFDIGDLIHKVRARPKGKRFATVLELNQMLTSQGNEPTHE